ncbi:class I SAM-dependent methyltransferase [Nitrosopumilus sp. S4]
MSQEKITAIDSCRVCNNKKLKKIISLGEQYIVNFVDLDDKNFVKSNLDLVLCNENDGGCGLLQLRETVSGELLYRNFWYKSGVNQSMKNALKEITDKIKEKLDLSTGDIVIDIGANDGTLLRSYERNDLTLVGFEPAKNLLEENSIGTSKIINDFFNFKAFQKEFGDKKAKIITSIAMFYDLEDPNQFVNDITKVLDQNGIWVIQMNYLVTMLENYSFDNIVHEHLEYYSLRSLENLLDRHGLEVFDLEINDVNGGSIRVFIKNKEAKYEISSNVEKVRDYEKKIGLENIEPYNEFAKKIKNLKEQTKKLIKNEVKSGKTVYVYGASTRGNTLLQYYGLDKNLIKAAADRNPIKWGKKIAGSQIPIISEEQARKENPDYFLILPWYFLEEFIEREKEYLQNGGKFIIPLPKLQIIERKCEV